MSEINNNTEAVGIDNSSSSPSNPVEDGQNEFNASADLGLHNAFQLLDIDSKNWKPTEEKNCDQLQPTAPCQLGEGCSQTVNTQAVNSVATGAADNSVELMTGCISSLQKLKLICPECRKTECCKVYLKKKLSSSMLDKFNLARSFSSSRGVIKEARFRPHPSDSSERSVLRASRLKFLSQFNANKRTKHGLCKHKSAKVDEGTIFGQCSERSTNFAFLAKNAPETFKIPVLSSETSAPQFLVYQNNLPCEMLANSSMGSHPQLDVRLSSLAANSVVPFSIEKTCSLQARLDDMSVNELACYFEEFVHIPKKMSEMAEMMYR